MSALEAILAGEQPWPDIFPARLSPSSIGLAAQCPEKWRRKYVQGERDTWGGAALIGLGVHRAIEENFRQKVESRVDLPAGDMREIAALSFEAKVIEAEKDGIEWGDTKPGDAKDQTVRLTETYHATTAPGVQPTVVEEWVGCHPLGTPELIGRIDFQTVDGIVDVKTTGRMMREPRGDWRLKGTLYVLMTGRPLSWHVVTKTKTPAVYTPADFAGLSLPASEAVKRIAERRVQTISASLVGLLERYGPDDPWPTNATEHDWSCGYCGFRASCPWWAT